MPKLLPVGDLMLLTHLIKVSLSGGEGHGKSLMSLNLGQKI
jgi:hypothetical protein